MKSKRIATVLALGVMIFVMGCVSGTIQPDQVFPAPEEGKGLVYFYRERKATLGIYGYNIEEHTKVIGPIKNGTYFFVQASPGTHTYTAFLESTSSRTIEVEAGHTYYIECGIEFGTLTGRPALKIANEAEAKQVLPGLKYITK